MKATGGVQPRIRAAAQHVADYAREIAANGRSRPGADAGDKPHQEGLPNRPTFQESPGGRLGQLLGLTVARASTIPRIRSLTGLGWTRGHARWEEDAQRPVRDFEAHWRRRI